MVLPRQSEDPAKPKKIRSTDDFGITGFTVYEDKFFTKARSRNFFVKLSDIINNVFFYLL